MVNTDGQSTERKHIKNTSIEYVIMISIKDIIERYKHIRSIRQLEQAPKGYYAFVGFGGHSAANLYPVLDYLHVPLKYICCRSNEKAQLISKVYPNIHSTTSLQEILIDEEVKGVFVSITPQEHFHVASEVLKSGKSLFVEKPPCQNKEELMQLITIAEKENVHTVVGLQKRLAPAIQILKKKLKRCKTTVSYNLKYLTGAYPEGDALLDLYIHPLDYVTYLFGKANVKCVEKVGDHTLMLLLKHENATGVLELSTGYSWAEAEENLTVNTNNGIYQMEQMENLTFQSKQQLAMGLPLEKIRSHQIVTKKLLHRNNFVPTLPNNQVYTQGYFDTIKNFVDVVECRKDSSEQSLEQFIDTFALLDTIRSLVKHL